MRKRFSLGAPENNNPEGLSREAGGEATINMPASKNATAKDTLKIITGFTPQTPTINRSNASYPEEFQSVLKTLYFLRKDKSVVLSDEERGLFKMVFKKPNMTSGEINKFAQELANEVETKSRFFTEGSYVKDGIKFSTGWDDQRARAALETLDKKIPPATTPAATSARPLGGRLFGGRGGSKNNDNN